MKFLEKLGHMVSDHPLWMVLGTLLVTVLMILGAVMSVSTGRSEVRTNINDLFPKYKEVDILHDIEIDPTGIQIIIVGADSRDPGQ